jgi:hypothetical protein
MAIRAGDQMTLIEMRPHRWGWKAFEAPGVEPVFPRKNQGDSITDHLSNQTV